MKLEGCEIIEVKRLWNLKAIFLESQSVNSSVAFEVLKILAVGVQFVIVQ
jgi:hypothetical protein